MDGTRIALERVIPTSPENLFDLWTDPGQLVRWWAPDGYDCSIDCLDARPGGRWRTVMQKPGGSPLAVSGLYRIVERPRRLAFTWAWELPNGESGQATEVTVTFRPVPGGTHLTLIHRHFQTTQERDRHSFGWSSCFDRITRLYATT
jgi:uncharacterized protein YndB with AHSA1/START domain